MSTQPPKAYDGETPTFEDAIRAIIDDVLSRLHLPMVARVTAFNATDQCCDARPVVAQIGREGEAVPYPVVRCCQVAWPRAASGAEIVGRLAEGDLVVLMPLGAALGAWWTSGSDDAEPESPRRGSLADAIAIPIGVLPKADAASSPGSGLDVRGGPHLGLSGGEVLIGAIATSGGSPAGYIELESNDSIAMTAESTFGITSASDAVNITGSTEVEIEAPAIRLGDGATAPVVIEAPLITVLNAIITEINLLVGPGTVTPVVPGGLSASQVFAK